MLEGLVLMFFGMGTVFLFLSLMVCLTRLSSAIAQRLETNRNAAASPAPNKR